MIQFARNSVMGPELPSVLATVATECGRQVTASNECQLKVMTSQHSQTTPIKTTPSSSICVMQLRGCITRIANTIPFVPQLSHSQTMPTKQH